MRLEILFVMMVGVAFFLLPIFFSKEKTYQITCPSCEKNFWEKSAEGYKCFSCQEPISVEGCGGTVKEAWQDSCFDGSCVEHCNQTHCTRKGYSWYTLGPSITNSGPLYLTPVYPSTYAWWRWRENPWSKAWWVAWAKSGI